MECQQSARHLGSHRRPVRRSISDAADCPRHRRKHVFSSSIHRAIYRSPDRDRFFWCPGCVLVCAGNRGINEQLFQVRLSAERFSNSRPNPTLFPASEANVYRVPVAEIRRQVPPRDPVRAMKSTASTKRRLSAARPPLSVGLPGNKPAIRNHCLSFNISRFMSNIQIPEYKHNSATVNRP